jgi:hypothetical protein
MHLVFSLLLWQIYWFLLFSRIVCGFYVLKTFIFMLIMFIFMLIGFKICLIHVFLIHGPMLQDTLLVRK